MENLGFYVCKDCDFEVQVIKKGDHEHEHKLFSEELKYLKPNSKEAAVEKHVPEVSVDGDTINVAVGSVIHPMTEEHHIEWVYVETEKGGQMKHFKVTDEPKAVFKIADDKALRVYAYCNLHGLWVKEL